MGAWSKAFVPQLALHILWAKSHNIYNEMVYLFYDPSTSLMQKDDNGHIWVHNNKQGFQDCEAYAELEKWLAIKTDDYLDKYVNKLQVVMSWLMTY